MRHDRALKLGLLAAVLLPASAPAEVKLPSIFSPHMVLQRDKADRVWGKAKPGEEVTVSIAGKSRTTKAGEDGRWSVLLDPLPAGGPHVMTVKGENTITVDDVLVGEVWICSGQSNMQFGVAESKDGDHEVMTANFPRIRLISVPQVGTQEPQDDFNGKWEPCTPRSVRNFSAVGYFFGRQIHQALDVPIGLIDDSWGGSAAEAWVRRDLIAGDEHFKDLMATWEEFEKGLPEAKAAHEKRMALHRAAVAKAKEEGRTPPRAPESPEARLAGNARPGNLYNGVLKPTIGYGIKGVIWYQGETNASRAYQYRELFPLLIKSWRDAWGIGEFPFYWVQLADYLPEQPNPGESTWAELREAQTMTMDRLPNTGQAVIIDLGEAQDIHPKNKLDVARRLARWALARDYGVNVAYKSPRFKSMEREGTKVILSFEDVGGGLRTFDIKDALGFAVAGPDRKFSWAKAKVVGKDKVELSADGVSEPVAVRYAWADNPLCNVYSAEGLPLTPFRTDDWPGKTGPRK